MGNRTQIKICGMMRKEDICYANQLHPEYIGFVFAKSKREITKKEAYEFRQLADSSIKAVGVFVLATIEEILEVARNGTIQMIQLHGGENEEYIKRLKEETDLPIIKVIREEEWVDSKADYFLFDAKEAGSGNTFAWELLPKEIKKPFFLAGGITSENAKAAIQKTHPFALDSSSGAERNGFKDYEIMKELIGRIRNE